MDGEQKFSLADIDARLKALEKRKIEVKDLPIGPLKERLQGDPQNPTEILLPNSITSDLLSAELLNAVLRIIEGEEFELDRGNSTMTVNGSPETQALTVAHRLGAVPILAFAISNHPYYNMSTTGKTDTTATFRGLRVDGWTGPETVGFEWFAVG